MTLTKFDVCTPQSLLASSLPHPLSELDYLSYQLEPGGRLLPGVELFADRLRCDPITLLSCLQFCAQQLVSRNHSLKVGVHIHYICVRWCILEYPSQYQRVGLPMWCRHTI